MCQRLMGSLDLIKAVRGAYRSKEGFDEHRTTRHSVPDSLGDQLKGAWFCLRKGLLRPKSNSVEADCYPLDSLGKPDGKVQKCLHDVHDKGINKIRDNFKGKLYDCFPDLRFKLLM